MRFLIALSLFFIGCVQPFDLDGPWLDFNGEVTGVDYGERTVGICGFNDTEEKLIKEGIDHWNKFAGYDILQIVPCNNNPSLVINYDEGSPYTGNTHQQACNGLLCRSCNMELSKAWVDLDKYGDIILRMVVIHELGHYFGLGHGFPEGCIMNKNGRSIDEFCDAERQEICKHWSDFAGCMGE